MSINTRYYWQFNYMNGKKKTEFNSQVKPKMAKQISRFSRAKSPRNKKASDF